MWPRRGGRAIRASPLGRLPSHTPQVLTVFAVLCDEVDLLRRTAEETFYPALAMAGHGVPGGEDPVSKDGDEELLIGRTLPFLQEAANLCERLHTVSINIVHQVCPPQARGDAGASG